MLQARSVIGITVYSTDDRRICFSLIRDRFLVQLDLDSSSLPMIAKNKFSTVERERERDLRRLAFEIDDFTVFFSLKYK